MSNSLDASRRHGTIIEAHLQQTSQVSINGREHQNRWSITNGCQQPLGNQNLTTPVWTQDLSHRPLHLLNVDCVGSSSALNEITSKISTELDGKLSGLQAAAAKTALVVDGKAVQDKLLQGVVTFEQEDCEEDEKDQSYHWIFRRHVGFSNTTNGQLTHFPLQRINQDGTNGHVSLESKLYIDASVAAFNEEKTISTQPYNSEMNYLSQQLAELRNQRENINRVIMPQLNRYKSEWSYRLSSMQQSYDRALFSIESLTALRKRKEKDYQLLCRWHALGDVFLIWHQGPFGTINGFRLGRSVNTTAKLLKSCNVKKGCVEEEQSNSTSGWKESTSPTSAGVATSFFSWTGRETSVQSSSQNSKYYATSRSQSKNANESQGPLPEKIIVPWNEINSALGQIVFLLYTSQNNPHSGISFSKHSLHPCGSTSKIGFMKKSAPVLAASQQEEERRRIAALSTFYNTKTVFPMSESSPQIAESETSSSQKTMPLSSLSSHEVTWYNLYHYEESGSMLSIGYYARRNFNIALEGLLYCIAEACRVIEKRDMSLAVPYVVKVGGIVAGKDKFSSIGDDSTIAVSDRNENIGEGTVGGLPLAYDPSEGERWTVVCKYLLTDLKWFIAYFAKHVDR